MNISDLFLLLVRWIHLVAAAAWIGGSIFYLLVLRPSMRKDSRAAKLFTDTTATEFKVLVDTSIFVLITSGVVLTFSRLNSNVIGVPYVVVLGLKILLAIWMFILVKGRRHNRIPQDQTIGSASAKSKIVVNLMRSFSGYNSIVILGIIVFLLSDLLKVFYELALK